VSRAPTREEQALTKDLWIVRFESHREQRLSLLPKTGRFLSNQYFAVRSHFSIDILECQGKY
jgi:hypothetical protein